MAGRGAPAGNVNAHKGRRFRAMLDKALRADPKQLERLAKKLLSLAEAGEGWALKEVADRLDGKPVAQVDLDVSVDRSIAEQLAEANRRVNKGLRQVRTVDGETILVESDGRAVTPEFAQRLLERLEQHRNPEKVVPALEHQPDMAAKSKAEAALEEDISAYITPPPSPLENMTRNQRDGTVSFIDAMNRKRDQEDGCEYA
jgi:hypothetical protein